MQPSGLADFSDNGINRLQDVFVRFLKMPGDVQRGHPLIPAAHRAQADALEIDAQAKRRLADEYDAAQERGEVRTVGNVPKQNNTPTTADLGISSKEIHEAREIRDAEKAEPGIIRRALDDRALATFWALIIEPYRDLQWSSGNVPARIS